MLPSVRYLLAKVHGTIAISMGTAGGFDEEYYGQMMVLLDIMIVQFRNEKVSNPGSIPLTVTLWPSSSLKKYGPMIPPANKAHQTPDGRGYELVSSVRALVPQKFSVEEELMHVKHVDVKSPHIGVMWKFGRGVISPGIVLVT
ncbi:hypothetical protein TNCV_2175361 [Trichonephila clavipes]|uniref:Uncharacterized protein n=1 Tax=Trichonephila clavipes TaxID=2585209 RepID=A0A8X6VG76_TRICX|nr:hypothetical protein TNCV_2175361 [Trichonephila clavipes]